ncbi:MAG: NADP-dependent oxidoreductase, partial [Chloroflexi bacterium]|nr:NADP-dependent oxidoreductase [Chloroflexota bacterium]
MKAVVLHKPGARPAVRDDDRAAPAVAPGRAVVRVEAAGFSHHDALVISGMLRRGVRT